MERTVRVRFAPSPTGPLHIGGLRTALFNYLFARRHGGTYLLRLEDTDQKRFVPGAEDYIKACLEWAGIAPDESPWKPGEYGPYRQSERFGMYRQYADQLLESGHAYLAFDTPEELEEMREKFKSDKNPAPTYNTLTRLSMKNSLTMSEQEVSEMLAKDVPYVIRVQIPKKEEIRFEDQVRGWVKVHSFTLDDKVLMKSDGTPTYHLANVVDDYLMKITHVIRGEEWLPSAPLHVLLYRFFGWEAQQPAFAHLPLILKPSGQGKLSKRDGDKLGFPVFPVQWEDASTGETAKGFREEGYLPDAFINFLALLGWNPGTAQEIFSLEELSSVFSMEKIGKSGTKFDIDKARWFNQQYLKNRTDEDLVPVLLSTLEKQGIACEREKALKVVSQMKERVVFPGEIWEQGQFYFLAPQAYDEKIASKKWNEEAVNVFGTFQQKLSSKNKITPEEAKALLEEALDVHKVAIGRVMQALRLALTGLGAGPDLMVLISLLGPEEVIHRIEIAIEKLSIHV